jgi:hypothetical protein
LRERIARRLLKFWEGVAPHLGQVADGLGSDDPQRPQMVVEAINQPYSLSRWRETISVDFRPVLMLLVSNSWT